MLTFAGETESVKDQLPKHQLLDNLAAEAAGFIDKCQLSFSAFAAGISFRVKQFKRRALLCDHALAEDRWRQAAERFMRSCFVVTVKPVTAALADLIQIVFRAITPLSIMAASQPIERCFLAPCSVQ
jgi:hypothetical protein